MKMRKLTAVLSAAAVAVTSFVVTASAATTEVAKVESLNQALSATAYEVQKADGSAIAVKENDTVTVTFTFTGDGDNGEAPSVSANGVAATGLDKDSTSATITLTADGTKLELTGDKATVTAVTVAREAAAESTPAETTPAETTPDEGGDDPSGATAPTVTFPSGEQTLTLAANTWTEGETEHGNYQGTANLFTGASIDAVNAIASDISVKVNLKDMSAGTGDKLNIMVILKSDKGLWKTVASGNFADGTTVTLAATAAKIKEEAANEADATAVFDLLVAFGTATDDPAFTEAPVIKFTFGDEAAPTPGDETTAAAPSDPGAAVEPSIRPASPETPASTTAATEVVTAANGESVEAAKDVVPTGAALEVKEQPKEEAVKAVEAVKATDANKEVVETIKKAVEDDKAAVVDIDLVKDGQKVQPNGQIKVTINIPESLKDAAKLFVYRVEADGTFTDVQATVEGGKIVFTTSHFSTYIITSEALSGDAVVTEAAATTAPVTTPEKPDDKNQATGVVLAVIPAIIAAAGVVVSKKRK